MIFSHFDPEAVWNLEHENKRMLASLAVVCRDFHQPAVRILWRTLDTIFPLLELLSTFVKVRTMERGYGGSEDLYVSNPSHSAVLV